MRRRDFLSVLGSAAASWPLVARAQQPAMPTVGVLSATKLEDWAISAIRKGLDDAGYAEGRNLTIIYRSADGQFDRLGALAADLISSQVSVILATGSPVPARVAKAATTRIPIVFAYGGDPVADGLVASFNRPGGNVTGATFMGSALTAKRMELLREIAPQINDVALLVNPKGTLAEGQIKDAKAAAPILGLRLHVINGSSKIEIDEAFATMSRLKVDALLVSIDPLYGFLGTEPLVALASRYKIPAVYGPRTYVEVGGLMSYGAFMSVVS
jgi:putative ABC transport system substrate-binding protein